VRLLVGVGVDGRVWPLPLRSLGELLSLPLHEIRELVAAAERAPSVDAAGLHRLPPVDGQTEVWASGVTYRRSMQARMEESDVKDVYSRVYDAERPELFFKSVAWKVVGDGDRIGIRADSELNVPEPELALVLNRAGELVGLAVCNDVSSRSIEGENPLYLPQAKVYTDACALGPGIRPVWEVGDPGDLGIECTITRGDAIVWSANHPDQPAAPLPRRPRRLPLPARTCSRTGRCSPPAPASCRTWTSRSPPETGSPSRSSRSAS
jgi:2-dehydro-3-deoxy-D-arabinonate dehydratase